MAAEAALEALLQSHSMYDELHFSKTATLIYRYITGITFPDMEELED